MTNHQTSGIADSSIDRRDLLGIGRPRLALDHPVIVWVQALGALALFVAERWHRIVRQRFPIAIGHRRFRDAAAPQPIAHAVGRVGFVHPVLEIGVRLLDPELWTLSAQYFDHHDHHEFRKPELIPRGAAYGN
jgi:hypothetical protein